MLPVPYNQAVSPLYTYPENNPPWVPPYRGFPEAEQFLLPAAAMVANALSQSAPSSVTRMFCYNLVSSNGWQNDMYADLVKLVLDGAMLTKASRGAPGNFYVLLQESVNSYTVLFASSLATMYSEFMQMLDPDTAHRVYQNANRLQDLRRQQESLYQTPQHPPGRDPRQFTSLQMNRPVQHPGHAGQYRHPGTAHAAVNPAVAGATVLQSNANRQVDDFVQTKFTTLAGQSPKNLKNPKDQTMEQKTHALAYRNTTVQAPASPVRPAPMPQAPVIPPSYALTPQFTDAMSFNEMNRETARQSMESATSGFIGTEGLVAIPCHVTLHQPVAASTSVKELFDKLKQIRTFAAASLALREIRSTLQALPSDKVREKRFGKVWADRVDKILTEHALEFFTKAVPNGGARFESLYEDGTELADYVSSNFNSDRGNASAGLNQYQRAFFNHLFSADAHSNAAVPDMEEGEHAVVDYEILTFKESVFMLNMTAEELNYGVEKTPERVGEENMPPSLFQLLTEATRLAKENDSTRQWFQTLDGERWGFFESVHLDRTFVVWQE